MEQRIKHLELIQDVIKRMAANSFLLKGWAVTLVAVLLAFGTKDVKASFVLIALIPALVFWGLDGFFLRQENCFDAGVFACFDRSDHFHEIVSTRVPCDHGSVSTD